MTRYALVNGGYVANVIEQEFVPQIEGHWVECGNAGPGWTFAAGVFSPPDAPPPQDPPAPVIEINKVRAAMLASGLTEAQADAILAAAGG